MDSSNQPEHEQLELTLRGGRIIGAAMLAGILLIAAIFAFLIDSGSNADVDLEILTYVCLFLTVSLIPLSFYLPKLISQKLNANSSFSEVVQIYRGGLIVSLAMPEGVALVALASGFIQRQFIPEYLIAALSIAIMLLHMPSKEKFDAFHREIKLRTN